MNDLQKSHDTCIRLLRQYERSERDRGNTHQADAIQRHIDIACAVGLAAKGVRENPDGSFSVPGFYSYYYRDLTEGMKEELRRLLSAEAKT